MHDERAAVGASITGRTMRRDGSTLSGVAVIAADGTATHSDAEGRFVLSGLPRGVHTVRAEAEGLVSVPSGPIFVRGGETIDGIDLLLDLACYVCGRVTSGQNQALAEASVSGRLRDAAAFPDLPPGALLEPTKLSVATDADGHFRLGPFAPGRIELTVEHEACLPFARLYPSDANNVQIALTAANCITGVVLEPDGQKPAVLERVRLLVASSNRPGWNVVTEVTPSPEDAAAGRFRLPVPTPQAVVVAAVTRDFAIARSESIRITPGKPQPPIELRASAGSCLGGRVHDATGADVAGAEISLRENGVAYEVAHLVSGADGTFGVALAPGRYTARIRKAGYTPQQLPIEIVANQPVPALDVMLVRGAALAGRLLAAEGASLPGIEVLALRDGAADASPEIAMVRDGAFAFDYLPPGDYRLALRERGQGTAPGTVSEPVHLAPGTAPTMALDPLVLGLARVRGVVTKNGLPMPFVHIQLARTGDRALVGANADRFGRFEFAGLAAGSLVLRVTQGAAGPAIADRRLDLQAGEDREEAVAVACGAVTGRVVAANSRQPIADVRVDVLDPHGGVLATVRSGQDGNFRMPMVPAGTWSLAMERGQGVPALRQALVVAGDRLTQLADVGL